MLGELLLISAVALICFAFYKWATINNDFFEKRKLKYMRPKFLVGNTGGMFLNQYTATEFSQMLYQAFPEESIFGFFDFRVPQFIVRDPESIKQIGVKDFEHFEDHTAFTDEKADKLWGNALFFLKGEKWRQMRATLSPAFTGSKMRQMFELVTECADDVVKYFVDRIDKGEKINIEMKDFFSRYTNDVIATCAFGLKINSLVDPDNEFYTNGKIMMDFTSLGGMLRFLLIDKLPVVARAFDVTFSDKKITNSFKHTILDTMEARKKNNIHRPDMINIMMQIREGTLTHQSDEDKTKGGDGFATVEESGIGKVNVNRDWNDDEIVAQCFAFFLAGFETTSTMLTFVSYELAANPDIQLKLHEEIIETDASLGGKRITYDALQKMKYMDQVISETLRKWPAAPQSDRICVKDYVYSNAETSFTVEKGTTFLIPTYGLHHDPKYFPEPEKFDPERFSDENKGNIIPGTYIPFGIGPRNCIGSRFALMEIKAILYYLLLNFSFEPNEKTQIPMKLKKSAFTLVPENGLHLELRPRELK